LALYSSLIYLLFSLAPSLSLEYNNEPKLISLAKVQDDENQIVYHRGAG
jgi:hypothetical protein